MHECVFVYTVHILCEKLILDVITVYNTVFDSITVHDYQ